MLSFTQFRNEQLPDTSNWKRLTDRKGSNPGGVFESPAGEKHYVKWYANPQQARSEVAAARIYEHLGLKTLNPQLIQHNGSVGVASKWNPNLQHMSYQEFEHPDEKTSHELAKSYHAAILTRNWDAVGMGIDNIARDANHDIVHVDMGGTFKFRAQGAPKPGGFSGDIGEARTLLDPDMNPDSAHVYSTLKPHHHKAAMQSVAGLKAEHAFKAFKDAGVDDPEGHTAAIMDRREKLLNQFS